MEGTCLDVMVRIQIPHQPFDVSFDAGIVREMLQQYLDDQGIVLDISGLEELPADVGGVPLDLQETFEVDLPISKFQLSDIPDLTQYLAAGKVLEAEIMCLHVSMDSVPEDSLNIGSPRFEFFVDEYDVTGITSASALVGWLPGYQWGDVQFHSDGGEETMNEYLMRFSFSFLPRTAVTIDTSVSRTIPDGLLEFVMHWSAEFGMEPL